MRMILAALAALSFSACSEPVPATTTDQGEGAGATTAATPAAALIVGEGDITAVDSGAGTVTINHGAIEAIDWPAMTMGFQVEDTAVLNGLAVGDHVTFQIKSAEQPSVITAISKD